MPERSAAVQRLLDSPGPCQVADVALIEVAFVLDHTMRFSRDLVADFLDAVLSLGSVDIGRELWREAIAGYRTHPELSIADCYLAAHSRQSSQTPLYTFDKKLARQLPEAELLRKPI